MWQKLFYDKYAGDHHFDNSITKTVSIDDLEDGSFTFFSGDDAINIYNTKFVGYYGIPDSLSNSKLYKLSMYTKIVDELETIYTVVNVNMDLLEKILKNNEKIPEEEFLGNLCRYHHAYTDANKTMYNPSYYSNNTQNERIIKNRDYIIKKSMESVDYTNDTKINDPKYINVSLYEFQKCSVQWMLNKEMNKKK